MEKPFPVGSFHHSRVLVPNERKAELLRKRSPSWHGWVNMYWPIGDISIEILL